MSFKIKITKHGPYIVSGGVPLAVQYIQSNGRAYVFRNGKEYPILETYALCRCGKSKNMPFCDGSHVESQFDGTETADRSPYLEQAYIMKGSTLTLGDAEELCAFARFCHSEEGNVWELLNRDNDPEMRALAIKTAVECPAGRLMVWDKDNNPIEPFLEPSIMILQDPERRCSGPLYVKGGIQIEADDGFLYEVRNRVTLCRCGRSQNKPFCDAAHVTCRFDDKIND